MTEILIDSSVIINLLQEKTTARTEEFLASHQLAISIITYFEVTKFFYKTKRVKELDFFKQKLVSFTLKPLTPEICDEAALISHSHNFSTADALIYATAKINYIKLLTSDSDLKKLPGVVFIE